MSEKQPKDSSTLPKLTAKALKQQNSSNHLDSPLGPGAAREGSTTACGASTNASGFGKHRNLQISYAVPLSSTQSVGPPLDPRSRFPGESIEQYKQRMLSRIRELEEEKQRLEEHHHLRHLIEQKEHERITQRHASIAKLHKQQKEAPPDPLDRSLVRQQLIWKATQEDAVKAIKEVHGGNQFLKRMAAEGHAVGGTTTKTSVPRRTARA